jgi:hypothetical protein
VASAILLRLAENAATPNCRWNQELIHALFPGAPQF